MDNRSSRRQYKKEAIAELKNSYAFTLLTSSNDGTFDFYSNVDLKLLEMYFAHNEDDWEQLQDMVANHNCEDDFEDDDDEIEFFIN